MRVKVTMPSAEASRLRDQIIQCADKVEDDKTEDDSWDVVLLIDPGQFRVINELLQKECKGKGRLETLTFAATNT
jgi:ribosome maturation protein SDO1